jgi:5-methylcytosine-specific restriction endonuclease McrA
MNISQETRFLVLYRDGFECVYCGDSPLKGGAVLQVDHLVPCNAGGSNDIHNLVAACRPCNQGKKIWCLGEEVVEAMVQQIDDRAAMRLEGLSTSRRCYAIQADISGRPSSDDDFSF